MRDRSARANEVREKLLAYAFSKRMVHENAEDFASWGVVEFLQSGREWGQWLLVDYLRKEIGRTDKPSFQKKHALYHAFSLDYAPDENSPMSVFLAAELLDDNHEERIRDAIRLHPQARTRFVLEQVLAGFTENEIAKVIDLTESRVSQIVKHGIIRIKSAVASRALADDERYLAKKVITLETRTCECGCGKTWRAMPGSANRYYSEAHNPLFQTGEGAAVAREAKHILLFSLKKRVEELVKEGKRPNEIVQICRGENLKNSRGKRPSAQTITLLATATRKKLGLESFRTTRYGGNPPQLESGLEPRRKPMSNELPEIESGIPIPDRKSKNSVWKGFAEKMKENDSVALDKRSAQSLAGAIRDRGFKAVLRKTENEMVRVWLVKPDPVEPATVTNLETQGESHEA